MAIKLDSLTVTDLSGGTVNWLLANVGDIVAITHEITVSEVAISSSNELVYVNVTDGYFVPGVMKGLDFSKFNIGDVVSVANYTLPLPYIDYGTYTIVDKPDNTTIVLNADIPGFTHGQNQDHMVFSLAIPITALRYQWNFIANSDPQNYYSKIDGSEQLASVSGLNPGGGGTNIPMTLFGSPCYQLGALLGRIVVDELGQFDVTTVGPNQSPVYVSKFRIKQFTALTPTFIEDNLQWENIQAGIAPDYFFNLECLRAVFYYEARYNVNDPNRIQYFEKTNLLGNTGWFNENWNTGLTNYSFSNLVYTDSLGNTIPSAQLKAGISNATNFSFKIKNYTTAPFVAGQSNIVLNLQKAPNDQSEYTANGRDITHNFVWDLAILAVDTLPAPVNGIYYGVFPDVGSLKNVKATFVNFSEVIISGTIQFDQLAVDVFEESPEPRYIMFASVANHALPAASSDRTTLLIDAKPFYYQTLYPNLLNLNTKLIPHTEAAYNTTFIDRFKFTEDELVGYTRVKVEPAAGITLDFNKFTAKILARNTITGSQFLLDVNYLNIPPGPYVGTGGFYQNFSVIQNRPIHVPSTEIRKPMIARYNNVGFDFAYPFLQRWEYWKALAGADGTFYDPTEPNDGFNHDWVHYFGGDWTFVYRIELNCKVNGVPQIYSDEVEYNCFDRNLTTEAISCVIDTYDGATQLVSGTDKYILGYKNTKVVATFNTTASFSGNEVVNIGIEVYEQGGWDKKKRMSSKYVSDVDTYFVPLTGETKTKLTFVTIPMTTITTQVIAETEIDYNAISALIGNDKWKITARIYTDTVQLSGTNVTDGYGYLGDQLVTMIKENPIPVTPTVVTPDKMDCCGDFVWRVLADAGDSNPLYNDVNSFLNWFDKSAITTATMSLVLPDGSEVDLTSNTAYGTPYDYGFYQNSQNERLIGYVIDWRKVLTTLDEGVYYVKTYATPKFGTPFVLVSDTYCLKQYTEARANKTVRVEYNLSGLLGLNSDDQKLKDLGTLDWYNSHRFDGVFYYGKSGYTEETVRYQNGQENTIIDEQTPNYLLSLKPMAYFKHDVFRTDIMMADTIRITDYNKRNIEGYYQKYVKKAGGYEPKPHILKSKLASVDIEWKQQFNNLKKFRT